jgi:hypothetical protein
MEISQNKNKFLFFCISHNLIVPLHAKNYNNDEKSQQNKRSACNTLLPVGIRALCMQQQ